MLMSDAFDLLARYAVGYLFAEKNHVAFPELNRYYRVYRKDFFQPMER